MFLTILLVILVLRILLASTGEVYKSLCSLKTGKVPGPDGILNVILKTFAFELAPVIADIYNSSLRDAYLPPLLKRAAVTPLPTGLH
jgi:hypothetical protein